jgi:Icc-related predicted phosphoesterase
LTDTEGFTPILNEDIVKGLDFVIISGDISIGAKALSRFIASFQKIRDAIPIHIPIYYIPGNREYEPFAYEFEGIPKNTFPIHNRKLKYSGKDGVTVWLVGFGSALPGINNNFVKNEPEIYDALTNLFISLKGEKNLDDKVILVSHNPPYNTKLDQAHMSPNVGSKSLRKIIEEYQPDICLCGHIHESFGIQELIKTKCVNPGAIRDGQAAVIEINKDIQIRLVQLQTTK